MIQSVFTNVAIFSGGLLVLWGVIQIPRILDPMGAAWSDFWEQNRDHPFEEAYAELTVRTSMARIRRRVSEECLTKPKQYRAVLERIGKEEALKLAYFDKQGASFLAEWVDTARMHEILYRPAYRLVWKEIKAEAKRIEAKAEPDIDLLGALCVRH